MSEYGNIDPTVYANMVATQQKEQVISAIKDLVNADQIVSDIRFQLTGKKQHRVDLPDGSTKIVQTEYHQPLINDLGANKLLADFRSYINPNVVLTYLKEKDILARSRSYYTNISFELARNMKTYEVLTKENHAKIRTIMSTNFHTALWRSYNGMTLLTSLKNISVNEIRDLNQDPRNSGLGGVFRK